MEAVADLLDRFRLAAYVEAFDEKGYDDLAWLLQMDGTQVEQLIADVGMKPGHAAKFQQYLAAEPRD